MTVDLSPYLLDVEHQLWVDSCTAHAGTSALELLRNKAGMGKTELDRHFLFYELRERSGNPDFGAHMRHIGPILKEIGCAPIGKWDELLYFVGSICKWWKRKPSARKYRQAAQYRISDYLEGCDIKEALDEGFPVIVGMHLREAFKTCDWSNYAASPKTFKHVMLAVGYRDGEYLLANSWGRSWGNKGLAWMPAHLLEADCYGKWSIEL